MPSLAEVGTAHHRDAKYIRTKKTVNPKQPTKNGLTC